jgi:hypothetical protein
MKKFIVILIMGAFCGGCYFPYPSVGVKPPRVEKWEKVCKYIVHKNGVREKRCRWVRIR